MSNNSTQPGDRGAPGASSRPPQVVVDLSGPPKRQKSNILLRSLGVEPGRLGFDHLGMADRTRSILSDALARPQGFVLAAGPPGSGRTTTIYAAVQHIRASREIMLTEERAGELFVPEIRDATTAKLAIQGARVGCLVVSTIRAHDATSAIRRMISLGISPAFLAAKVRAIIAQRLVRMVCDGCREETAVRKSLFDSTLPRSEWRGYGCARCGGSGYRGCTGIFELLVLDDEFRRDLAKHTEAPTHLSVRLTGPRLYEDGVRQVRAGVTTVKEVLRVTALERYPRLYTRT